MIPGPFLCPRIPQVTGQSQLPCILIHQIKNGSQVPAMAKDTQENMGTALIHFCPLNASYQQ